MAHQFSGKTDEGYNCLIISISSSFVILERSIRSSRLRALSSGLTLHQESEKSQQDGLDISFVKIDFSGKTLDFAGAALDMLLYGQDSQELIVLKGSKYSIGGLNTVRISHLNHGRLVIAQTLNCIYTPMVFWIRLTRLTFE